MVSGYELFLWLHVLAVIVWLGGGIAVQILAIRITRAGDGPRLAAFARDAEFVGKFVFSPASLVVLAFGFALVSKGDWGYPFWVIFGLAGYGVSGLIGGAFLGPEAKRIATTVEAHGPDHPEVTRRIKRIFVISRIELVMLFLIVFDMAVKPFA